MLIGKIEHQQLPSRDEPQVNPDKIVKDPACGRVWDGLSLLFRKRLPMVLEGRVDAILQHRIDQQTHRHHHQQDHDPLKFLR